MPAVACRGNAIRKRRRKNGCDDGTVLTVFTKGKTMAPEAIKKRKTSSPSKKQAKDQLTHSDTAETETDWNMSTNLFDKCKRGQESLLCSGATTEPKKRSESRKVSSVTLSEEPAFIPVSSEMLAKSSAETSSPVTPKIPTS